MKFILPVIAVLLFAALSFGQSKDVKQIQKEIGSLPHHKYYRVTYVKAENRTFVSVSGAVLGGKGNLSILFGRGPHIFFDVFCYFDGRLLDKSIADFYWVFSKFGREGWSSVKDRALYVTADNQSFALTEGYHAEAVAAGLLNGVSNDAQRRRLAYLIDRATLQKLAAAKSLTVRIDNQELIIKPDEQQILKDALALSEIK